MNGFAVLNGNTYAALPNGAIKTSDEGKTWQYIYKPHALHGVSTRSKYAYAMMLGAGLLRTSNECRTWENANNGFGSLYTFEVKSVASYCSPMVRNLPLY